jgi:phosphate-selective porin OprO/OprP
VERNGYDSVKFRGGYVYASWILSGESRNYDAGSGSFLPLTPNEPLGRGGKGAFELAARISHVDLSDQDIIGGQESNISFGLNWYLNEQFRVMGNLIKVIGVKRAGSEFNGEDPLILALRLQWQLK